MEKNLTLKGEFEKPQITVLPKEDVAYIKFGNFPKYPVKNEFIDEYIVVHIDTKNSEIVGLTITELKLFIQREIERSNEKKREEEYYRAKAKEMVKKITEDTQEALGYLPSRAINRIFEYCSFTKFR